MRLGSKEVLGAREGELDSSADGLKEEVGRLDIEGEALGRIKSFVGE